jgi:PAS domain S-box-containing protein
VRRRRATSRKPAKPQQTIKAKRGTVATRNRRLSASSKDRKVARLAREREDPMDQLRLVIDTIPTLVWSCRPDGAFDYVSRRWSEYTGISAQDALGSGWMAAYHPDDIGKHQEKRLASLVSGEPVINEVRLRRADGQYRWHLIHGVPLRDASGNIVKWYGAAADIEDRKRAEQALRRSERELRDLIETMPAMAVAALPDGSPTFVNRRWTEYTGLSAEDTEGSGWKTAIHPEDFERWLKLWRACLANGQPFEDEARFRRASDGEYRWFWTRGVPLRDAQGNLAGWYGLGMDIQDRKTAEQERERLRQLERQAERELQLTIDTIPAIVVRHRRDGSPEFLNQTWRTYTGLSQDSLHGQRWGVAAHPDDLPKLEAAWRAHLPTGQPFELEQRLRRADGEYRWFFIRRVPLRDENGQVIRWYAAAHDIDDQKRAEHALQTAQAELAHVTRVTTLGEMSASIAHEINQPLAAIVINAEATLRLLSRDVPDVQEPLAAIADVIKDAHRAAEVIRRIRDFSKKAHPLMMQLNINEVVEEAVKLVRHEALQHGVTIRFEFASGLPPVRGDRIQLQQVIVNLAVNGMEAMTSVQDRERVLIVRTQRDQSDRILVAVADAGVGIEPENLNRVFGAFHTTKPGGLGMGLAICRSIIDAHGGRLWADANMPGGAIFRFTVRAAAASTSELIQ